MSVSNIGSLRRCALATALLAALPALGALAPRVAVAQPRAVRLVPSLELVQGYTDRSLYLLHRPDEQADELHTSVSPALALHIARRRTHLLARGGVVVSHRSASGDTLQATGRLLADHLVNRRVAWSGGYSGDWGNDRASGLGAEGLVAATPQDGDAGALGVDPLAASRRIRSVPLRQYVVLGHALGTELNLRLTDQVTVTPYGAAVFRQDFSLPTAEQELREYAVLAGGLRLGRALSPSDTVSAQWEAAVFSEEREARTYLQGATLAWTHRASPRTHIVVTGGVQVGVAAVVSDPIYAPVASLVARHRWSRFDVAVGLERAVLLDATLAGTTLAHTAQVTARARLGPHLEGTLGAAGTLSELAQRPADESDAGLLTSGYRNYTLHAGLGRRFLRRYRLSLRYLRLFVLPMDGDAALANEAFDSNLLEVSLSADWT